LLPAYAKTAYLLIKVVYNLSGMKKSVDFKFVQQEQATLGSMIGLYCHAKHNTQNDLCSDCQDLFDYAGERLERCLFLPDKPVCARCPVHCYQGSYRERVREVMRFSGPRLILKDPVAVLRHFRLIMRADSEQVARLRQKMENK